MTWETVPFNRAFVDVTRQSPKVKQREFASAGRFPVVDQGVDDVAGFWDDPADVTRVARPLVLFGDHTRRVKYATSDFVMGADGVKALAPCPQLEPRFAFWWLSALSIPSAGYSRHFKFLQDRHVPIPQLAEQRRIAAILDEADALIKMARTRRNSLDDAEDSLFAVTLGDTVGLERRTLADFAREFRYGTSEKSGPSGVPVLRIPNLTGRVVDTTDLKTVSLSPAELSRLELSDQDVLFVRSNGNPNVVGRAGAFASVPPAQRDGATWVFASYLIRSRLAEGVSARAVVALTRSPIAKRHFRAAASTSAGQYNISIPVLRALPMFDPTSERTTEFERGMDHIERLRTSARRAERFNHELFASLQHRAFRGEL